MNDADIETNELNAAAAHIARLQRKGICCHGWYSSRAGTDAQPVKCLDCGKLFASEDELQEERREFMI